jgi:hypothetical protein
MFIEKIESIRDQAISKFEDGETKSDVARYIQSKTDLKWSQSKYWSKRIYDEFIAVNQSPTDSKIDNTLDDTPNDDLEFSHKYVYVKDQDKYIFLLHNVIGKNFILTGSTIRSLVKNYSNFDGEAASINEVSIKYKIPRNIVTQILKIMGITHDSLPVTNEELCEKDEDSIIEDCLQDKKFSLYQKLQKKDWVQTKEDAKRWNALQSGTLDPISRFLDNWTPPKQVYVSNYKHTNSLKANSKKAFLSVLTDNHIGELTENTYRGDTYNSTIAIKNILNYLQQIDETVSTRTYKFDKCVLVCLGDLLNSCLDGLTRKGTQVNNDIINEDLFDIGLDVLVLFIEGLKSIFGKVEVKCTKGNHDSVLIYAIYSACKKYFQHDKNITFDISKLFIDKFKVYNNYFIYTHGAHDTMKIKIPKDRGAKMDSFFQSLLLSDIKLLDGVKGKYVLSGDTHSFEYLERNDFEFIVCSASVKSNEYAESLGYTNMSRQQGFILGEDYIEEILNFYL